MPGNFLVIPMPFKNKLVTGKWLLKRLPHLLRYKTAIFQHATLELQIERLPTPVKPPIYWVELNRIKLQGSLAYPQAGRLCLGGDWDINMVYTLPSVFESIPAGAKKWALHETVRSMFIFGKHYKTTPQYISMIQAVEQKSPNPPQGCRTVKEVDEYFLRLLKAFKSMQTNGYLTQDELGKSGVGEMQLHLTRDGRICLGASGNHRIRMAEILAIRWVPFLLRGVHPQWVLRLSQQMNLPPHEAIKSWVHSQFPDKRPAT